jgi:6-phosphogluconolactonase (cycloisomerase 2 family)
MKFSLLQSFKRLGVISLVLILGLLALSRPTGSASALSTTTVTTTAIVDDPNDGQCDLWEALQAIADYNHGSNADGDGDLLHYHECTTGAGPHFIVFAGAAAGGTITLPTMMHNTLFSGLPFITDNVTITGPVVIDGGGAAVNSHIFWTNGGANFTLANLVIKNGYTSGGGGAIVGFGGDDVLNIIGCSIMNNVAEGNGGAINMNGQINIMLSNFSGNKALGMDANGTDYEGNGGAIYQTGYNTLNISLSNFAGNIASEGGGAIYTMADSGNITDSVFNGNIVNDDAPQDFYTRGGGAIANGGNNSDTGLVISRVAFNGNLSFNGDGGAIFNAPDGYLHVYDSSFNGNIAGTLEYAQHGGAIYNQEVLDIQRVMFLGNVASSGLNINDDEYGHGGAVANDRTGVATLANVSFTANGAPGGFGGGVWNGNTQQGGPASYVYLYNTTFSFNTSLNNDGAAIYNQTDGYHEVYVANTIVDGLGIGGDNCNEALTSQGHNIDSGNTCGFDEATDQPDTDPKIKTLDFNGGPLVSLLSHGLESDSPAIDAGDNDVCSNDYVNHLDQRSDPRPKGNACDIGAFESDMQVAGFGSLPVPPGPIVIGNTSVGTPLVNSFTLINPGNIELEISNPQILGEDADQFEVVTAFPVTTDSETQVYLRCLATAEGEFSAAFGFMTNVPDLDAIAYEVTCNVGPAPTPGYGSEPIAPGTLDFGPVAVGNGDTSEQTLTYFETGNETLTVNAAELTGANPFDFTFNGFDTTILDGDPAATLPITCTPSAFGLRTATLTLATTDPTQPTVTYTLVCEGIAPPSPPLTPPENLSFLNVDNPELLNETYDVAVSPDGQHVYVTNYVNDKLLVFARDGETGVLSMVMEYSNLDMGGAAMVEVSPDGTQVYLTAIESDAFLIFDRNPATGMVFFKDVYKYPATPGLDYPFGITVSPDGQYLYVASFASHALVTFYRDADGFVGYQDTLTDNVALHFAYNPVISPDGKHIYVSGGGSAGDPTLGYVSAYERDTLSGALSFVEQYEQSDPGCFIFCIWGLQQAWGITVSPDGKNVYVTGYSNDSIVRFVRDPFDGTLTYGGYLQNAVVQTTPETIPDTITKTQPLTDTTALTLTLPLTDTGTTPAPNTPAEIEAVTAEGLDGAISVKVSPDGRYVYVTALNSDAVSVFARNLSNGVLTQIQTIYDDGSLTLNGAREIGLSPDGTSVYITSYTDGAVQLLQIANPIPTLSGLLPASVQAGSGGFVLKVQGENFLPGSIVRVAGNERPTTYLHPGEVEVTILASDISVAGSVGIQVVNPAPGGGLPLNPQELVITSAGQNPIPAITSLTPAGSEAGVPGFTVSLYGMNFINSSTVTWNGVPRAKTYVNSTHLQITVTAADLLTPGPVVLTVVNGGPGGGTSNAVVFDVADPGQNPVPTVYTLGEWFTIARGAASRQNEIVIHGANFVPGALAQWNGQTRPTKFISETELIITLTAYDAAFAGAGELSVLNPGPGGGSSNALTFIIYPYGLHIPVIVK